VSELGRPVGIVAFSGSIRKGSFNQIILDLAVAAAEDAGAKVDALTLADYPMPLYNADLQVEEGVPDSTHDLYARIREADAVMIASPEYNAGYTPLLKNTIDWLSRIDKYVFMPRKIGLLCASTGRLAGAAARQQTVRLFETMFVEVYEETFGLGKAKEKIIDGRLVDGTEIERLDEWTRSFVAACVEHAKNPPRMPAP
jgi:NAD(P)H-dependent FMN reductase